MQEDRPQLYKSDFVNPDVLDAVNPHPVWGYAHGPIPNNNPDWKIEPSRGKFVSRKDQILAFTIHGPQAPMVTVNSYNTLVCDILVEDTQMCGISFCAPVTLNRHVLAVHAGAVCPRGTHHGSIKEKTAGDNAIKRWVLMGGWRDALYSSEPSKSIIFASLVGYYCDTLEEIARTDAQFAAEYGTQFHRPSHRGGSPSGYGAIRLPRNQRMRLIAPSTSLGNKPGSPSRCEQSTQTQPTSDNDAEVNPDFTSGSGADREIVSKSVSEVDSEPEDQEEWPVDAVTDIFAGLYLPSSRLDAAYGPMSEGMD